VTPSGLPRTSDETWRDRFKAEFEKFVEDKHKRTNDRIDDCERAHERLDETLRTNYVSKESLKYQLENINDRYEPIRSSSVWLMRIIVGGFLAALAQYVYVHAK